MLLAPFNRNRNAGLARLHDSLDEMFESFFRPETGNALGFAPALDVAEREDALVIKADLPGVDAENIDVSVHGNTLTLSGHRSEEKEDRNGNYYHVERRSGAFKRTVQLPAEVDPDQIEARCKDGVLTIEMKKHEREMPRKVQIKPE
ncbi:MAG: Hsp20/alpha crystallin family protein [Phycisphaerae bacterium]